MTAAAPREQKLLAAAILGLALVSAAVATQSGPFHPPEASGKIELRVPQTSVQLPARAMAFALDGAPVAETPMQGALLRDAPGAPMRLAAWPLRDLRQAEKRPMVAAAAPLPPPRPAALAIAEPDLAPPTFVEEARAARLDRLRSGWDALASYAPSPRLIPGAGVVADAVTGLTGRVTDLVAAAAP